MKKWLLNVVFLCLATSIQAAPKATEAETHAYRVTMKEAGDALKNHQAKAAFNKILPVAKKGFVEAQYVIATMYQRWRRHNPRFSRRQKNGTKPPPINPKIQKSPL